MDILETVADGSAVLHVAGRVTSANAPELGERLRDLLARGCRSIVVDLSHLVHMTSAGFRSLLRADKLAGEEGSTLVLCGLHGLTLELFEIGGFLEMFTVAGSRDEAVRRAASATPAYGHETLEKPDPGPGIERGSRS
jgi:anti-sigma B factor antagonist